MAPSTTATQSQPSKVKRPVPPGIQTNGINSSTSSPSPSISNSRLPSTTKLPTNPATSNGAGSNASGARSASRNRRDAPPQLLGRGQRNSSVGMRSASLVGDSGIAHVAEPQPYVKSDAYILKKYRGCPPSLVIHLHPNHFRFDQQEGSFTYKSPMRIVIEHLRDRTIPHDLVEFFNDVPYYEGCMIVQIYDHKSIAPSQNTNRPKSGAGKTIPFSVHNYNAYLTPSSYVPYPTEFAIPGKGQSADDEDKKGSSQKDKENMPAPDLPGDARNKAPSSPKQPKISTIVLRPTTLSNHADLAMKAAEGQATDGRRDSRQDVNGVPLSATVPPTPTTAIPSTPQTSMAPPAKRVKKSHAELTSSNIYAAESQITFATTAPLMLEPVSSAGQAAALLESLAHPMHSDAPPAPKTRKRTVAEMAADEAQAADQERHMLIFDERLSPNTARAQGGGNPGDSVGQAGGVSFEPRFERFKTIENLKAQHEETKRVEKLRREEAERKSRQEQERNKLRDEAEKREQEKARLAAQQQMAANRQQQLQQESQRRQMVQQAAQSQAGLQQSTPHLQQGNQIQTPHAHPQTNGLAANGMAAQPQRFHQQVSQAQASSPIVRNGTPQSHSSPIVNQMGNVPMQQTTSSIGGSPPRPGSVVHQNHPQMGVPTGHPMSAQRSQQSHAGTPRMPNSTPNIQSTPLSRQMSQTPRMSHGSPMQASMAAMQGVPAMNGQQIPVMNSQQAQMLQQQRMAQIMRNTNGQQQQQAAMNAMVPQPMSAQQQYMAQQMMRAQQVQQQGMPNQLAQTYASQMAAMAQRSGGLPPNMNQNMMNNNPGMVGMPQMTMQQMQQQMQMQQMRQHAQAQVQAQAQHNPQQAAHQAAQQHLFQTQVVATAQSLYNQQRPKVASSYANGILPDEIDRQLRLQCQTNATQTVQRRFQAQRAHQQQQMMAQAQVQGMQQNMNGMQGGMGM
ncbi:Spt20 family-domain-containing protein [Leptodontidium sp. 2 PMI_412]|nr:Spt20 family-domain-containing protein [Leptodontidium sp. 2 PMI_412]